MEIERKEQSGILSGRKFPVYLLHGSGEFLQRELADGLVDFLLGGGEGGDAVLRFDCGSAGAADILNGLSQPQMFSPVTVVVVENAQEMALEAGSGAGKKKAEPQERYRNWDEWERFRRWAASPPEDTHLILIAAGEMKSRKSGKRFVERAYGEIEGKGCAVRFPKMYDEGVARWVVERSKRAGLKMTVGRAEYMIMRAGSDLRHLANELEKLALYCGEGGVVDEAAIEALATSGEEEVVFKLVDAVFDGRKADAAEILGEARKGNVHPLQVLAGLTANIRMVWQARRLLEMGYLRKLPADYRRAGYAGVKRELMRIPDEAVGEISDDGSRSLVRRTPFYVHKCVRQARRLPLRLLERWIYYCARADRALKGISRGSGPEDVVFDRLIAEMMREIRPKAVPS